MAVSRSIKKYAAFFLCLILVLSCGITASAISGNEVQDVQEGATNFSRYGGGYAATGQISGVSYTAEVYDASNGLPTSDSMFILAANDGSVFIGGYSGVMRYDGSSFERLDTSDGLTSARGFYQDSKGRIWVATNDNGAVVLDGKKRVHLTYKDGLPSSSLRIFAEDKNENVFIGTATGLCYADKDLKIHEVPGGDLSLERILRLDTDSSGKIYGATLNGTVFAINNCKITEIYEDGMLGSEKISTILADPLNAGSVYIATEGNNIYHGTFGKPLRYMERISVYPLEGVHWLSFDCGRVFASSPGGVGYIDTDNSFHVLKDLPIDSGIEMTTSDYQGNIWISSSTQGVMKIVTNNFSDLTVNSLLSGVVANAVHIYNDDIYIGTNTGLMIIGKDGTYKENPLLHYLGDTRIRCISSDNDGNIWVATFTNDLGVVCFSPEGNITSFTTENGMPDNCARCITFSKDGSALIGTNGGLAVIKDGKVVRTVGTEEGIKNTVFLTVEEEDDGRILVGTDGDGIYVIDGNNIEKISRDEGLTSDVVMKVIKDDFHGVTWLVTSNSIEYIKDGKITELKSFPYNNNYDLYFDDNDNAWILSSYGLYKIETNKLLRDDITNYSLYTIENGLPYAITSNSFSAKDAKGNLYIPGREGVIRVNVKQFYESNEKFMTGVRSVYIGDEEVEPDEKGVYVIPPSKKRVQITASVMDYTLLNPTVKMYLEGGPDEGITTSRNKLTPLEYTNLPYGTYTLHIQILNKSTHTILQDETYTIKKTARITELWIVRVLLIILIALLAGLGVWKFMHSTVVSKQYEEISRARDEAERANTAKSRFLANMSHEIRTPINTIMGMNEMALREDATGVPKSYFMSIMNYSLDIRNATESLLGLINDLLDMSKIESGKMHLVEQEYDLQDMLRSIVSMIRVRSTEKELTFDVVVDEILPKRLYGDMGKIKQIVLNLLTNAVKYTEVGGFVLGVYMDERDGDIAKIRFSVKDTGMGVKEEDLEKLFTAYERLDEEKNSGIQGTGLGLDISRRFAELMNGSLVCESVYGEGSEFILSVTQKIVDEKPIGAFIEHDDSSVKGPYVPKFIAPDADVLVVDDNPMNLTVIKGLLKPTKVFVTTATSGEDAIEKIKDSDFNIVLLDHMMPGMDGIETVGKIREFAPDLPVYALTANSTAGEEFYKEKGFNGYLPKPIDSELLEKTILKHLPEEMMEKPEAEVNASALTEIPEELKWIYDTEGITVSEGVKNSGGIETFIFSLNLFLETIDDNSKVIWDAFENENFRLYTIKVHALKSSARFIGAIGLSEMARELEDAGNRNDTEFIYENNEKLMTEYAAYKERLKRLQQTEEEDTEKEPISEEDLVQAYEALSQCIEDMDYDAVEMTLSVLFEYELPEEEKKRATELEKMLKVLDWEGMAALVSEVNKGENA